MEILKLEQLLNNEVCKAKNVVLKLFLQEIYKVDLVVVETTEQQFDIQHAVKFLDINNVNVYKYNMFIKKIVENKDFLTNYFVENNHVIAQIQINNNAESAGNIESCLIFDNFDLANIEIKEPRCCVIKFVT